MTVFLTVVSGVLIYLLGQVLGRFVLEPLHEQRVAIREVDEYLVLYGDAIANPGVSRVDYMDEASRAIRNAASNLRARTNAIPMYGWFARMHLVRPRAAVTEATKKA